MSLARNVAMVGSATLLSRLLGFARDMGIAALIGAGALSDAYFAALQVSNFFRRLLAEGALNAAFVPMWLRRRDEAGPAGARTFSEEILGAMTIALLLLALACEIFAPQIVRFLAPGFEPDGERQQLAALLLRISALYLPLAGVAAVLASMLNARARVGAVALGGVVFNCVLLASLLLIVWWSSAPLPRAVMLISASIVLAGLAQLALVAIAIHRTPGARVFPRFGLSPAARLFFARALPGVVAAGIPQITLAAGAMIASSSPAAVSWLYYANRLYELPLGVLSVATASVLAPLIAASRRINERDAFAAAQSRAFEIALGLALPAAIGLALLAQTIAVVLFERGAFAARDSAAVAAALAAISIGLPGHVLEKVFGAICFAHEDTRAPLFAALTGLTAAALAAILLFPGYGHVGIAAAIGIGAWTGAAVLGAILLSRGWLRIDADARRRLPFILLAALVMGVVLTNANDWLSPYFGTGGAPRWVLLAGLIALGIATYLLVLRTFRVALPGELLSAVRAKS
jgi:putative peptidoglycan lipid II flippase